MPKPLTWDDVLLHDLRGRDLYCRNDHTGMEGRGPIKHVKVGNGEVVFELEWEARKQFPIGDWTEEDHIPVICPVPLSVEAETELGIILFKRGGIPYHILRPGDNLKQPNQVQKSPSGASLFHHV